MKARLVLTCVRAGPHSSSWTGKRADVERLRGLVRAIRSRPIPRVRWAISDTRGAAVELVGVAGARVGETCTLDVHPEFRDLGALPLIVLVGARPTTWAGRVRRA